MEMKDVRVLQIWCQIGLKFLHANAASALGSYSFLDYVVSDINEVHGTLKVVKSAWFLLLPTALPKGVQGLQQSKAG